MSPAPTSTGWALSRWLFLRLLGVVYLVAFGSLAVQVTGLIGDHGLLPAGSFLDWAHSVYGRDAYRLLPTLFWLGAGNAALQLAAWGGVGLAILLMLGVAPMAMLALLWALYLSFTVAGQDFLSFQWDALLLETGLLAILWAPSGWLPRRGAAAPSSAIRWLLVFLLFKLMFLSGATKLLSGDPTWQHLTALDYHFETQPLPTWVGWYAHQLPSSIHRAATAVMFAIELGAPWLLFAPSGLRQLRYLGVGALLLLQSGIALTGNYGFFNLLAMALCVPALDDDLLRRIVPLDLHPAPPARRDGRAAVRVLAPVLLCLSVLSFWAEIAYTLPGGQGQGLVPRWGLAALAWVAPLRSFNGYGLFRVMTTERPELAIEGSRDGVHWSEYQFRWKPGPIGRRPGFVAPHHPRLDWQLWFAALDPLSNLPLLRALSERLRTGSPDVLALLDRNPFPGDPPRFFRFARFDYRFTTSAERSRTGAWWRRELVGYLPQIQ